MRQVIRPTCPTCGPETPKQKEEREEREDEEATKEEEAEDNGTVFVAKSEFEGGEVRSFSLEPKVEDAALKLPRVIYAGYRTAIEFESLTDLTGGTVELQRFVKGVWQPLAQATVGETTTFFVKLPAGHVVLRPVAKSASVTLPLEPRKLIVHKLGKHRLTSAAEDGRYGEKPPKKSKAGAKKPMPLSFAVVDGGTRVVHLRATIEGICAATTRSGEEVPLTIKAALRSARIAPDGTVVAQTLTKGPEPQRVSLVGQLLDGSLFGKVSTSFANCGGSREIKAFPVGKH
jgi:hypothetical protein